MKKKDLLIKIERLESKVGKLEREMADFRSVPLMVERKEYIPPTISPDTSPYVLPLIYNKVCPHCGGDSGWSKILCMVIPPEGLRCMSCGKICIQGNTITCSSYESHTHLPVTMDTKPSLAQFIGESCSSSKLGIEL